MKDKTILGSWCTKPDCRFIDATHIQVELVANIWYAYDNDSKTSVISKEICFVKEINLKENDEVEIIEEDKKIPEKLDKYADVSGDLACNWSFAEKKLKDKINEIIDYLKSKGE